MSSRFLSRSVFLATLLVALIFGIAQAASSVTLDGYTIDFLGATQNGTQSTWTYAVSVTGTPSNGLSHLTFGFGSCATLVAPPVGNYTTPTTPVQCSDGTYTCQSTTYTAEHGLDPTTGINGIKFGDAADQLEDGVTVTHIFEFTLENAFATVQSDQPVAIKASGNVTSGFLTGAACATPTAVTLATAQADAGPSPAPLPVMLALLLLTAGAVITRRRAAA